MFRLFFITVLTCFSACSPGGSLALNASTPPDVPAVPTPPDMDLQWLSFGAAPHGVNPMTAAVTTNGLLSVSGEIGSTDASFSGDVGVSCILDGGAAGPFVLSVSMLNGYGSFIYEQPVGELNLSPGATYSLEGLLDPDKAWSEVAEGAQNVTSTAGWPQFVEVIYIPQGSVDRAADSTSSKLHVHEGIDGRVRSYSENKR